MESCQTSKVGVDPLLLAGRVLGAWRRGDGSSQRGLARLLGVKQPTWRNVELGVKPPGRVLFIRMILFLKFNKKQILSLSVLYHHHNIELPLEEVHVTNVMEAFGLDESDLMIGDQLPW